MTYPKLLRLVREQLGLLKAELTEERLQSLWVVLDEDGGGFVSLGEFGRFMKRATLAPAAAGPSPERSREQRQKESVEAAVRRRQKQVTTESAAAQKREEQVKLQEAVRRSEALAHQLDLEAARLEAALPRIGKGAAAYRGKQGDRLRTMEVRSLRPMPKPGGGWLPGLPAGSKV